MGKPLVFQSDFGYDDGAVSAMYGVAYSVDENIKVFDVTHNIPQYNIWEASYRLIQTVNYWPKGTVFVSVVDPGVGSTRRSIVVLTEAGQYIVTPDNGTLTHIKRLSSVREARIIDESVNRLPNSGESYTFHGRDIYAYTGARLASGVITYEQVGPSVDVGSVVELPMNPPVKTDNSVKGSIDVLDVRFGSLWTNVPRTTFNSLGIQYGDKVDVIIENSTRLLYRNTLRYAQSFDAVYVGEALVYVNSLDYIAVAINQGNFSKAYGVGTGAGWTITLQKERGGAAG
ncbi:MAG: SAM hydrolase/SAM-dependent halogenase family protein [Treponema sp.]|uniref:SAM hydrolase/SAM-dependent halogenase family protein n=1 Tax=Treponema sp. TaxID=166 RepID=UPI003FA2E62F